MTGKGGEDLYVKVPVGTLIYDDDTDELVPAVVDAAPDEEELRLDADLSPAQLAAVKKRLPGAEFVNISDHCLHMQIRKTPEEIALCIAAQLIAYRSGRI